MTARFVPFALATTAATVVGSRLYHRRHRNWGATQEDIHRHLPGDKVIPHAASDSTMAITIAAPPEAVWTWLVQMGVDRAGFYSHTWLENGLLRLRVVNADQIVPRWQELKVGDHVWFTPAAGAGRRFGPTVVQIEPNRALILGHGDDPGQWAGTWQFVLEPVEEGTRLVLRTRAEPDQPVAMTAFNWICEPGYDYMDIGMLKGIRERAERAAASLPEPGGMPGQRDIARAA